MARIHGLKAVVLRPFRISPTRCSRTVDWPSVSMGRMTPLHAEAIVDEERGIHGFVDATDSQIRWLRVTPGAHGAGIGTELSE